MPSGANSFDVQCSMFMFNGGSGAARSDPRFRIDDRQRGSSALQCSSAARDQGNIEHEPSNINIYSDQTACVPRYILHMHSNQRNGNSARLLTATCCTPKYRTGLFAAQKEVPILGVFRNQNPLAMKLG